MTEHKTDPSSPALDYDRYWADRPAGPTQARSRRRARLALGLLGPQRGRLLEVGCGPGYALEVFRDAGFEARGIDLSPRAVELARARGLDVDAADVVESPLPQQNDVVVALEVLEHVVDPLDLLKRLVAALVPPGRLVVSLPNEWHILRRLAALVGRPGFGGHDDPHVRHFDVAAARRLFDAGEVDVVRSVWDGLLPPRWRLAKRLTEPLAAVFPRLLALSGVHLLRPRGATMPKGAP